MVSNSQDVEHQQLFQTEYTFPSAVFVFKIPVVSLLCFNAIRQTTITTRGLATYMLETSFIV